jgi:antimicrobial peptide system SdpA family protein
MNLRQFKLGLFFIFSIFISFLFVYYIFINAMPFNPLVSSPQSQTKLVGILPQGWAFFTKSPRDPNFIIYKFENNKLVSQGISNISYYNYFGVSRKSRIIAAEGGSLISQTLDYKWTKIDKDISEYLICCDSTSQIKVLNSKTTNKYYCGDYIIQKIVIVPWAWSNIKNIIMPSEYIKVKVVCAP